jgi:flagellar basal body rod protein FlgG
MQYGMYISAEGAQAQAQRLAVIANNLANVDTVGFKRDVPHFQARFAEAVQNGQAVSHDRSINDVGGGVKIIDVQTDYTTGRLQRTSGDLDMAIVGDGFFQVLGRDNQVLYTRAGNFDLDPAGRLVSQVDGSPVLDQSGKPIILAPGQPWSFRQDGTILQGGTAIPIGLSRPQSMDEVVKVGHNRFRSLGRVNPVPLAEREVRQGFLEMSGSNPTQQMMALIETSRAFEANTRMVQNHDSMTSGLLSRVLRA